ncbi:response regulator transcription factor [Pandoraea pnomenusa]|uniref:LytR/AlgR family response regulator transcription factor n=1 Tax=Pandoraea pnomenusa TaxID=93220 RepID=UPI0011986782|nr:LytTR family DNA-binding domain-containing protein [Pandoraea pnomenusa]QDX21573.1 response regulator transcription factor [Pandoraea pnomenusa]
MTSPLALIAEDEPLLAEALRAMLAQAWPELRVLPVALDGTSAIAAIVQHQPEVVFLDIAMPGATGLDVARACARLSRPPQIVFVTAFDRFALDAFDAAAVDYLLKPVQPDRLARTVARLRDRLDAPNDGALAQLLATLRERLQVSSLPVNGRADGVANDAAPGEAHGIATAQGATEVAAEVEEASEPAVLTVARERRDYLRFVRASVKDEVRIVPVEDVCFFEAADKYVVVATTDGDLLIRTSLRELLPQLDPSRFWQVHRSTVVNVAEVVSAQHTPLGRLTLKLRRRKDRVAVSRQYAHLFRQM